MQQRVMCGFRISVCDLLLYGVAGAEIEVAEDRGIALGPGITAVIIAQAQSHSQVPLHLPGIFHEKSEGARSCVPTPQLFRPCIWIVINAVLVGRRILCKSQQIRERKLWLRPRTLERFYVVAIPALVTELQSVRTLHMGQYIAPVIVMLNEIALREADAECLPCVCVDAVH